jgi:hypothetical protein
VDGNGVFNFTLQDVGDQPHLWLIASSGTMRVHSPAVTVSLP